MRILAGSYDYEWKAAALHKDSASVPTISVVVPTHSLERWALLVKCVESLQEQTAQPRQIVVSVDNNPELYVQAKTYWKDELGDSFKVLENPFSDHLENTGVHERAHGKRRRFGAGTARNAAVAEVDSDIVAFTDDDAWADPDWLERLLAAYSSPEVVAVGGAPLPSFETDRPGWFPESFGWIYGCVHSGLPDRRAPTQHLIGANMSVRREAFYAVGTFQSVDFDDLDLCMRLAHEFGNRSLIFEPGAIVHHYVPVERVTWRYFYRRCFFVNMEKVLVFKQMGEAANLRAEVNFVTTVLKRDVFGELRRWVRGDADGLRRAGSIGIGILLSALGNLYGKFRSLRERDA